MNRVVSAFGADHGAISRADYRRMRKHADLYYAEIRKRTSDIIAIARNTGFSEADITNVKNHIFHNKYDLGDDEPTHFDPHFDMAVSWQRLIEGKNIQAMDIILLRHELLEYELMSTQGLQYRQAHDIAEAQYNYANYIRKLDRQEGIQ